MSHLSWDRGLLYLYLPGGRVPFSRGNNKLALFSPLPRLFRSLIPSVILCFGRTLPPRSIVYAQLGAAACITVKRRERDEKVI